MNELVSRSMLIWLLPSALVALAAAGCGARNELETATATSGTGGSVTGGGGPGGTSSSSSSSSSSSTGGSGGVGGGNLCGVETSSNLTVEIERFDGQKTGCRFSKPGSEGSANFRAEIISKDGNVITFDECSPGSDCIGRRGTVTIDTQEAFGAFVAPGAFVEIGHDVSNSGFGCAEALLIKNRRSWDGAPNPVEQDDATWLAAATHHQSGAGGDFTVEVSALGCFPNETPGCGKHEDYVFRVGASGSMADVPMGQTLGVGSRFFFSNLESYTTNVCDAGDHFAFLLYVPTLD